MTRAVYYLAKLLEVLGLLVILLGLLTSVQQGMNDDGLSSMRSEMNGLVWGSVMFGVGWMLERSVGARS